MHNELVVSADWSSVELVIIGDQSGDPEFARVFGQKPYGDLHSGAASDILEVPEEAFKAIKWADDDFDPGFPLLTFSGEKMTPRKFYKWARTELGKGSNFNYFYSGSLSTVGDRVGWTSEEMWAATERYRERYAVAEQWRQDTIAEGIRDGYVTLPDGHTREKYEATPRWMEDWLAKFENLDQSIQNFARRAGADIQRRARNQLVNAKVQGTCSTLAKRTILRLRQTEEADRVRLMMPVHDELVNSVKTDYVLDFIPRFRSVMCDNHDDIVRNLPLECTVAIGRTFEPFDLEKAPYGQIELDEAPYIPGVIEKEFEGKKLDEKQISDVIKYLS